MSLLLHSAIDVERWRRIESVLDVALELEPNEVAAYLDRACADSPELRAQVEALLEADRRADGFLSVPPAIIAEALEQRAREGGVHGSVAVDAGWEAPEAIAPPARVGRYRILGELGRGGMGIVFCGCDETLDREVAIKSLPPALAGDPKRLGMLLREAKLLGALHHPNIAGIRGIEQAEGRRYLILEKVDGVTLSELLRTGPLALPIALDCAAQAASALAAAHAYGIVHRDLKPGNIMLTPGGLVKVLDFGLAKHTSDREGAATPVRANGGDSFAGGARLGTPGYMSPEQILGLAQDGRTDLFAIGAVLYHALTGERAFRGASVYAVLDATLNTSPDLTRLPQETPAPVRDLLARLLEKDPGLRPAEVSDVAAVLARAAQPQEPQAAPSAPAPAHAHGAPETAGPLIGRHREIAEVLSLLDRAPIVTLIGAGGCGKTRVAIEVARAAWGSHEQPDANDAGTAPVWFADLTSAGDGAAIAAIVAAAARLRDPSETGLAAALKTRLGDRVGLLVLDNCDRILRECAALAIRLLAANPRLRILATSSERLGIPGEQTITILPLPVPDTESPLRRDTVRAYESARLFEACAAALPGGFQITDANAGLVAAICRDLDGVPLAIELAAALLRHQTLDSVAAEIAHADRHDPLRGAIRLGYQRLSLDERRFLRALSVFTGGWNLEAAAAVSGAADDFAALDLLTRLVDKSLVTIRRADRIEPRYGLLEPIRHFAAAQAELEHDTAALRARHRDWFVELAERAQPSLQTGASQADVLSRIEADHPNLLAALAACEGVEGATRALRLAGSIWLFWYIRGHFARGREGLARALALPGADAPSPARAQALYAAGGLALFQGDYAEGRRHSQTALELFESLENSLGVGRALLHLGLCESGEQQYAEARDHTQRAIAMFRRLGEQRRLAVALNNLGLFKRQQGDFTAALPDHEEALLLLEKTGDRDGMLVTRLNLALACARLGRDAGAGRHVDAALELVQDLRARRSGAAALEVAAEVLARRGLVDEGARAFGHARALRARIGLSPDPGWRRILDELASRLRAEVGEARLEMLLAEGGDRSFEDAVAGARARLAPGSKQTDAEPEAREVRASAAVHKEES